ncbi:MAG: serine dehydratase beta chain, partial [Acetobacteraceae bacterium]
MAGVAETMREDDARRKAEAPISVVELFTIGIGPSSSHTVGPMRAAFRFAGSIGELGGRRAARVLIELFGSLALTGKGHRTDAAVILGLSGWQPETVDPDRVVALLAEVRESGRLMLAGRVTVPFSEKDDLLFRKGKFLPRHPNAVRFTASFDEGPGFSQQYYSIGGGAIVRDGEDVAGRPGSNIRTPYPFASAAELLAIGHRTG